MLDKIDKGTAISVGLVCVLITMVFAAGALYSQVQRNTGDITSLGGQVRGIEDLHNTLLERMVSVETKLDILIDK